MTTASDLTVLFEPSEYHHWKVQYSGSKATVSLVVEPNTVTADGYTLKSNSYDLGVYIELADIIERMRFEHPEVGVVVLTSGVDGVFCAGANISMLAGSTHGHKVNFCKFTNETLNAIEDASTNSEQVWIASLNGTAAGGGYEMALACDEILMIDDRASTVALPEVPLLGVLPGTGGLTRLVDKRKVRRDRADVFSTKAEGLRAKRALEWGIVDYIAPRTGFDEALTGRVDEPSNRRLGSESGVKLEKLNLERDNSGISGRFVSARFAESTVEIVIVGPDADQATDPEEAVKAGSDLWLLTAARELDNILLELRFNEVSRGTLILRTVGDPNHLVSAERLLAAEHWYSRELSLYWARTLRRLDLSARSIIALILPGSCFAGVLAEIAWSADRTLMLDGDFNDDGDAPEGEAALVITSSNGGLLPMANGLTRLESRFYGDDEALKSALAMAGVTLYAGAAFEAGLVLDIPDDIDWHDEVRLMIEERTSFSPDALTGMEASLRFVGPETVETKIFGRLTAWQNWIFQRPNAAGPNGALRSYGSGHRPEYNQERV